jgi:hypothetical protein
MFNTSKLSPETQDYLKWLALGERPRSLLTTLVISKAIADLSTLPSGPVDNPEQFFTTTSLEPNQNRLYLLNELVIVDTDAIQEYTLRFYKTRYNLLHPADHIFCANPKTTLEDFMGLSIALDPAAVEAIGENNLDLTRLYNGVRKFFAEAQEEVAE